MPLAKMNSVELDVSAEKRALYILGERKKLEQAFINIIKNAIEAMPDGGKTRIKTTYEHHLAKIRICGQGKGMI